MSVDQVTAQKAESLQPQECGSNVSHDVAAPRGRARPLAAFVRASPVVRGLSVFGGWLAVVGISTFVELGFARPAQSLQSAVDSMVGGWDAGWLRSVAQLGYSANGAASAQPNRAFYPLYPLAERSLHVVSGFSYTTVELVLGLSCQAAFLVVVSVLVDALWFTRAPITVGRGTQQTDAAEARGGVWVVVLVAAYPASIFALQGYATSMMMLLLASGLLFVVRKRLVWAALLFGLATAVNPAALAVPIGYALYEWIDSRSLVHPFLPRVLGRELLSVSGLLAYMGYLWASFGDPIASFRAQQAWYPKTSTGHVALSLLTFRSVGRGLQAIFVAGSTKVRPFSYSLDGVVLVLLMGAIAVVWWRGRVGWQVLIPLVGAVPLLVQAAEYGYTYSVTRLSYPLWTALVLHPWCRRQLGRRRWTGALLLATEIVVLAIWVIFLCRGWWVD